LINCANNLANGRLQVHKKQIRDQVVDASIKTMKYLNGPHDRFIGPQMSPCICSKKEID